jgi:cation transport regulator ChaC
MERSEATPAADDAEDVSSGTDTAPSGDPSPARRAERPCWIFGYGSLIWRPSFAHVDSRPAHLHGFARRFWQASVDHRGTPEAPGRVVTLVSRPGDLCAGVAFRVAPEAVADVLAALDERERGGYVRRRVTVCLHGAAVCGPREAVGWVYVADASNPRYVGPSSLDDIAAVARRAHGPSGPNREYVIRLAEAIRALGASDPELFALAALVARGDGR